MLQRQTLMVNPVSGFMDNGKECLAKIVFAVPRGDAHIARTEPCCKRMSRDVQTAALEVVAYPLRHLDGERFLVGYWKTSFLQRGSGSFGTPLDAFEQPYQRLSQGVEDRPQALDRFSLFVRVQQRIIGLVFVPEGCCLFTF